MAHVPTSRITYGAAWRREWERAHEEMAAYGRVPSIHLIDNITWRDPDVRGWLAQHYAWVASTTHLPGAVPDRANAARAVWHRRLLRPDTMRLYKVRVVLEADEITIVTVVIT